jgi:hypothetical protein
MMKRRSVLAGAGLGCLTVPGWLSGCASGGAPLAAGHSARQVSPDLALLNRVTWGVDSVAVREFSRLSRRDYLQAQLHPAADAPLPVSVQAQIDALGWRRQPMQAWVVEMEQRRRELDAIASDDAKKAAQQAYQQDMNRLARDAATRALLLALY